MTAGTAFEVERIKAVGIEAHALEEFGYDELLAEGVPAFGRDRRCTSPFNACRAVRHRRGSHPLELPDVRRGPPACERGHAHARSRVLRRSPPCQERAELEGIRRAQGAATAAMGAARDLMARAERSNGSLTVDGEPLTSRAARSRRFGARSPSTASRVTTSSSRTARRPPSATSSVSARSRPTSRS